MPRFRKALLPLAALLAIGVIGWRLATDSEQAPPTVQGEEARSDYYVNGARMTRTNAQGEPEYVLTAVSMLHRPDLDSWLLEAPTMVLVTDSGAPWNGQAERGRIWADGDQGELLGEVRLWREASADNRPVTIMTRDVQINTPQRYAETAATVRIRQQINRLNGTGARVYLDEERYELLSDVRGHYVPMLDSTR